MKKRILSLLLALCMIAALFPVTEVHAADAKYYTVEKYDANGNGTMMVAPTATTNWNSSYGSPFITSLLGSAVTVDNGVVTGINGVNNDGESRWYVAADTEVYDDASWFYPSRVTVIRFIYVPNGDFSKAGITDDGYSMEVDKSELIKTLSSYDSASLGGNRLAAYNAGIAAILNINASAADVAAAKTNMETASDSATAVELKADGEAVESIALYEGQKQTLTAELTPLGSTDKLTWTSSDPAVVSVTDGVIKGMSAGTATVTVAAETEGVTDSVEVTVTGLNTVSVSLMMANASNEIMAESGSLTLRASAAPAVANLDWVWSVEDPSIAEVTTTGYSWMAEVRGKAAGTTNVIATLGSKSAKFEVKVTPYVGPYIYFDYDDPSKEDQLLDENDTITLTCMDAGKFVVGNAPGTTTWSGGSANVSSIQGGDDLQYWVFIGSETGVWNPWDVRDLTVTANSGGWVKSFTVKSVSSGITELKTYIGDEEVTTEAPYESEGKISGIPVTVKGKTAGGDWITIPTQALHYTTSDATYNIRWLGNQLVINSGGQATMSVFMKDNWSVKQQFVAKCNYVALTGFTIETPETFTITGERNFMNDQYYGLELYSDNLKITYTPSNATHTELEWEALTPDIAFFTTEHNAGIVPKTCGTAKFKVTSKDNPELTQEVTVTFLWPKPLESATLEKTEYALEVGESEDLNIVLTPADATEKGFKYTYDQNGIVEIKDGKIVAKSAGEVTVTATPLDTTKGCGSITFTVNVTVSQREVVGTGTDGNIVWTFYNDKTLSLAAVEGSDGAMNTAYTTSASKRAPWVKKYASEIQSVVVEEGVTTISDYAFYNCANLRHVTLPASLRSIGSKAFYKVTSVKSFTAAEGGAYTVNGNFLMKGTAVALGAMGSLSGSITIPDGVTELGNFALFCDTDITSVTLPEGLVTIGESAVDGCSALTSINIPTSVRTIRNDAFYGTAITSAVIPEGVTAIESNTFYGCASLESVSLPSTLETIGASAFYNCSKLKAITIPEGITAISKKAFQGCTALDSVSLPSTLQTVEEYAFHGCSKLKAITLPEGAKTIGNQAFYNCTALESISLPSTLETIGTNAFYGCTNIASITVAPGGVFSCTDGMLIRSGTEILLSANVSGTLVIPDGITTIAANAFIGKTGITSVSFPASLTNIGQKAFSGCTGITGKFTLPGTVTTLGYAAFEKCSGITEVYMEDLADPASTSFGSAFSDCDGITTVRLPANLKTYPNLFYGCDGIAEIVLPEGLEAINNQAFSTMSGLKRLVIPASVKTFTGYFVYNCSALEYVEFKSLEKFTNGMFYKLPNLQLLVLPGNLTGFTYNSVNAVPKMIAFYGTQAQWEAAAAESERAKLSKQGVMVLCNYNPEAQIDPPTITRQPQSAEVTQLSHYNLTIEVEEKEGFEYWYEWYLKTDSGDVLVADGEVNTSELGTFTFYCLVKCCGNGGMSEIKSADVAITVKESDVVIPGSGTEADPYLIGTAEQLGSVSAKTDLAGETWAGKYFKLTADITLPEGWQPIGTSQARFAGHIDGDGNTLTVPVDGLPLLGYVKDAYVKNLKIYGQQIAGAGLVNSCTGLNVSGNAITIENVRLLSGTKTLKSGLVNSIYDGNGFSCSSAGFVVTIKDCVVEEGVTIGYAGDQNQIGSFANRINGTIENCTSSATVKGVDYVGGILGTKDNAMGQCEVKNSTFHGTVEASGSYAGGILGGGYANNNSAPNGGRPSILACTVDGTVKGNECVGGITGGDRYVAQTWENVTHSVTGNTFNGKISGNKYVGGIIGFYNSLNKYDNIAGNTFSAGCGADQGIGFVQYLDTSCENPTIMEGTIAFNTGNGTSGCPTVQWCAWKTNHNRTDDPLGKDADSLCKKVSAPVAPTCYELKVSGTYKTEYTVGEELNLTGIQLTASWTDGTTTEVALKDVQIEGYDKNQEGNQTVSLSYGAAKAYITVAVKPVSIKITVSVSILGDSHHEDSTSNGGPHGLAMGGLTTWVSAAVEAETSETVWNVLQRVAQSKGITFTADSSNAYGTVYIRAVNGLSEFDNGSNSGWMYTVNGTHPEVGVGARYVSNGDKIVLHYTDDYTYEEGGVNFGKPTGAAAARAVDELIDKIGTVTLTDACKQKIDAARKAYDALSAADKEKVTKLSALEAAEKKYSELKQADDKAKADNVIKLINQLGTPTLNSDAAINAAWDAYNALTADQKKLVTNLNTLQTATQMWNQLEAQEVIKLINQIDASVTEQSEKEIQAARKAYNALTADQKKLVTNFKDLTDAETALAKLVATDEDNKKAQEVTDLIDKLTDITTDSEKAITEARKAYDALTDLQKQLVENYDVLEAAEEKLELLKALGKVGDPYATTGDYMEKLGTPSVGSIGGEWMVLGLARSDREVPNAADYYQRVVDYVRENIDGNQRLHKAKSTDNSRLILALTALGYDVTNVDGHNLLLGLNDLDFVKKQGINGPIWALLALDSGNYPAAEGNVTRAALIQTILDAQLADGGWALSGDEADSDLTAMALQALAPYYVRFTPAALSSTDSQDITLQLLSNVTMSPAQVQNLSVDTMRNEIVESVDRGIAALSAMQNSDGGFSTFGGNGGKVATSESASQVIVALTALGINPDTDERFVKNGQSAIDALLQYYVQGGGFKHILDGEIDGMATEQAYYALTAYYRFLTGKTSLYNMTDVINMGGDPIEVPEETTVPETTAPVVIEPVGEEPAKSGGFPWLALVLVLVVVCGAAVLTVAVLIPRIKKKH